jgi:hypothetical protein
MRLLRRNYINFQKLKSISCIKNSLGKKSKSQKRVHILDSPHHFKRVKISATALVKMVMHTRRGGDLEVMGMMQGKVRGGKQTLKILFQQIISDLYLF